MIDELKQKSLELRKLAIKEKDNPAISDMAKFSGFLISQIENVGKNNGNRKTTDDEATKTVMKTLATLEESFKVAPNFKTLQEIQFCKSILPSFVPDQEILDHFSDVQFDVSDKGVKGKIIASVKSKFQGRAIDMKRVSVLLLEHYKI